MEDAFTYVIWGVVVLGVIGAIASFALIGKAYEEIGKNGLFTDEDGPRQDPAPGSAADLAERDDEIRQMLTARNARRAAAGREVVDVEAELARLTAVPSIDAGLRSEIRDMVVARNARRVRRGQEPLDVDAEVERQVREFEGGA